MKIAIVLVACLALIGCGFASISETRPDGTQVSGFGAHFLTDPTLARFKLVNTTRGTGTLEVAGFNSRSDISGADLINALTLIAAIRGGSVVVPATQP